MRLSEVLTHDQRVRYVVLDNEGCLIEPIARYLKHLDQRGYARNTLRSYGTSLQLYFEYLTQKGLDFRHITIDDLAGFVQWLKLPSGNVKVLPSQPVVQARANRTINHVLTAIAGFYDYLWRRGDLETDINAKTRTFLSPGTRRYKGMLHHLSQDQPVAKNLLMQRESKSRPKTLTKAQIETLIRACGNIRDRLLLMLLYEAGLRIGESLALWLEDVDVARYQLRVRDRGELPNRAEIKTPLAERTIDVSPELIYQIMDYAVVAHTETIETNHVFLKMQGPRAGQPLEYADVHDLFQRLKGKTGIDASAHMFRHTSFTHLAKAGWLPEHLRERAGHANFQYTYQLYVHPNEEDLRDAWEQTQEQMKLDTSRVGGKS
jgi:integrase/recombinase XerD